MYKEELKYFDSKFYLDAIKYIPVSIVKVWPAFFSKKKANSWKEVEKKIQTAYVPFLYLCCFLFVFTLFLNFVFNAVFLQVIFILLGFYSYMSIGGSIDMIKDMKRITCECGHLIEYDENVKFKTLEDRTISLSCVCQKCQTQKKLKCNVINAFSKEVDDYSNEEVLKVRRTDKAGEYEFFTDTKRVRTGSHSVSYGYQSTEETFKRFFETLYNGGRIKFLDD